MVCTYLSLPFSRRNSCESAAFIYSSSVICTDSLDARTHHVFPYTENAYTSHFLIDNISSMCIWCLAVIARNTWLTRIIGLPFSCIGAPFKPDTWCAPGYLLVCMRIAPHIEVSITGSLNGLSVRLCGHRKRNPPRILLLHIF